MKEVRKTFWHRVRARSSSDALGKAMQMYDIRIPQITGLSKRYLMNHKYYFNVYYKLKRILKPKYTIWYSKMIYDSPRGSGHDFFVEIDYKTNKELTSSEVEKLIKERIAKSDFKTNTHFKDFAEHFTEDIWTGIEMGETTSKNADNLDVLFVKKVGYRI